MYIVLWKSKSNTQWQGIEAFIENCADAETVVRAARIKSSAFEYAIVEAHPTVYETQEEADARLGVF